MLDVLHLDSDLLALVSMLTDPPCAPPYRSLRERAVERVVGLYRTSGSVNKLTQTPSPMFQMVIAVSSSHGPDAFTLAGVAITWLPASPRADAPPIDALQMACSLWQPARPGSRFETYLDAYAAVQRLLANAHAPVVAPDLCTRHLPLRSPGTQQQVPVLEP